MTITLNHTIVWARDKNAAARFFAEIFGLRFEGSGGHFAPVRVNDTLTLDFADAKGTIAGQHYAFHVSDAEFDAILRGWISERTVKDVVTAMTAANVPCSPIMTSKDIAEDPQYRARGMHVEWEDEQVGKVKGIGVAPKFSLTPGKIVRGSVPIGHDNDRVYREMLGVSADDLESLRRDKVI